MLHSYSGKQLELSSSHSIRSFAQLKEVIAYASFDTYLFAFLLDSEGRTILKQTLLQVYFPVASKIELQGEETFFSKIENQILQEEPILYKKQVDEANDEELFVRSGVFKRVIPTIYNNTCCITKMKVISTYNIQMIDACHIKPFSVSHDDTISNGISLCPNMHRAFDRGLIALSNDYRILVSDSFDEVNNDYSLKQYAGMKIYLPQEKRYLPHIENIMWHRENIFK